MPSRDWRLRLQDILESISEIEQQTKAMTFEEFAKNQTNIKAVLYDFIIIGEATRNVPKEIQSRYPLIPWRLMAGMRNVAKGDVTKLCEHTRELMFELNAAGETTNDLLANLLMENYDFRDFWMFLNNY